jgi:hypothetical protein
MSDHTDTNISSIDLDAAWIADWAAEGIAACEALLAKHAAFAEYLRRRSVVDSVDGDRRPDA